MASTHVEISNSASRLSGDFRSLVSSTRAVSNKASELKAIADAYLGVGTSPAPDLTQDATYADLAIALGFTGQNANKEAHTVYNLLVAAQGRLTGAQISAFIDNLG